MNKIQQLPFHEAQKIAAGEVIDRPANVVKELVENSIDAGATTIHITIENGGTTSIQVIDNGCGMSPADALRCFDHHATSKIKSVEDLTTLSTFGFRGEALTSIDAVSEVHLVTKCADIHHGTSVKRIAGALQEQSEVACQNGTQITAKNIFFNLPARLKFIKSTETELRQIIILFQSFCFDYVHIHFSLTHNNRELYNCPPVAHYTQRVAQIWSAQEEKHIIAIEKTTTDTRVSIKGFISDHQIHKYDRNTQFFFVNQRWVKNLQLSKALMKGYGGILPPDRFPIAVIHIEIDPQSIDVNIHPRKHEVQFLHPRVVEEHITQTIKHALHMHMQQKMVAQEPSEPKEYHASHSFMQNTSTFHQPFTPLVHTPQAQEIVPALKETNKQIVQDFITPEPLYCLPAQDIQQPLQLHNPVTQAETKQSYTVLGQLFATYIIVQNKDALILIDQHAAHERIMYEKIKPAFTQSIAVDFLFPQTITLSEYEANLLEPLIPFLLSFGFRTERINHQTYTIYSSPTHAKKIDCADLIKSILQYLQENSSISSTFVHEKVHQHIHAMIACKAAIKGGDTLTMMEMEKMITDLYSVENFLTCPHGRPTGWVISRYEIERKFKRC